MAAEHFAIQPDKVTALAADFTSGAGSLGSQISTFATAAENVNDAFGVMSESTTALQKYVEMTQSTVASLRQLQSHLDQYATGLRQTVTNYQTTDTDQASAFNGTGGK